MQLVQMLREIESRLEDHDEKIEVIFEAIKQLIEIDSRPIKGSSPLLASHDRFG